MAKDKNGFYQCNNNVLSLDVNNDINEIRFNHYIMRKENLERINGDLPKGCFKLTLTTAEKDLGISKKVLRRIIETFIKLDIITRIDDNPKGSKLPSIYAYNTVKNYEKKGTEGDIEEDTEKGTEKGTEEPSKINGLSNVEGTEKGTERDTEEGTEKGTSKKEYIKREYKNKFDIDDFEELWKLYPNKKGKAKARQVVTKLLKNYSKEELTRCIKRYSKEVEAKEKQYILYGSTFFNGRYEDYLDSNYQEQQTNSLEDKKTQEAYAALEHLKGGIEFG